MEQRKEKKPFSQEKGSLPEKALPPTAPSADGVEPGCSLPCLNSNISDEPPQDTTPKPPGTLSPYHKKAEFALSQNVERFCSLYGLNCCGFLTLTFPDNVEDHKEASRRFNNMNRRYLSTFYGEWIWARERQKRGAWHYHLVVQCKDDIRKGFDWSEFMAWIDDRENGKRRRLKTGNPFLRSLWEMNNRAFPSYGFGRVELLPIRSTGDIVAKYVGKYISKQIGQRPEEDKGVRLTGHSAGFTASKPVLAWNSDGAKEWRRKLALFAAFVGASDMLLLKYRLGPNWAYKYNDMIQNIDEWIQTADRAITVVRDGSLIDLRTGEVMY